MTRLVGKVKIDTAGIDAILSEAKKRNVTLQGARAAGKVLKLAARGQAPVRSGATQRAQAVKAAKGTRGATTSYAVQGVKANFSLMYTPKGKHKAQKVVPAFIDHLIQLGTKAHSLAKGARVARVRGKKTVAEVGQGTGRMHPGARANPYRQRAWDAVKDEAGAAALDAMGAEVVKIMDRAAAKFKKGK